MQAVSTKMAASSSNKTSKTVDFLLRFICQLSKKQKYTNCPTFSSIDNLITITNVRCSHGETEFNALQNRIKGLTANELLQEGVSYHNQCYSALTNKTLIDRAKDRYEKGQATGSVSDVKQKKKDDRQNLMMHLQVIPHHSDLPEVRLSTRSCVSFVRKTNQTNCTMSQLKPWEYSSKPLVNKQIMNF